MAVTVGSGPAADLSDHTNEKSTQHVESDVQIGGTESLHGEDYPDAKLSKETILACIVRSTSLAASVLLFADIPLRLLLARSTLTS